MIEKTRWGWASFTKLGSRHGEVDSSQARVSSERDRERQPLCQLQITSHLQHPRLTSDGHGHCGQTERGEVHVAYVLISNEV